MRLCSKGGVIYERIFLAETWNSVCIGCSKAVILFQLRYTVHSHDNTEVLSSCFPFERFEVSFFLLGSTKLSKFIQPEGQAFWHECQLWIYQISLSFKFWFQQDHPFLLLVNVSFTYQLNIAERAISDSKIYEITKIQSENENHLAVPYGLVLLLEEQWIWCSFRKKSSIG